MPLRCRSLQWQVTQYCRRQGFESRKFNLAQMPNRITNGIKTRNFKDLLERNEVAYDYILFKKGVTEQEKLQFGEILFNQNFSLNNKNEIMKVVHSYIVNNISFKDINNVEIKDNKLQFNLNNNSTKTMEFTKSEIEKQKLEFAIEQLNNALLKADSKDAIRVCILQIEELEQKLSEL